MLTRATAFSFSLLVAVCGCKSGADGDAGASPTASASQVATAASAPSASSGTSVASVGASIAGVSISRISAEELRKALEANGYVYEAGREIAIGSQETVVVKAKRNGRLAAVTIVRPSGKPKHDRLELATPEQLLPTFEKKGAAHFEGGVLCGVEVEESKEEAVALLKALLGGR